MRSRQLTMTTQTSSRAARFAAGAGVARPATASPAAAPRVQRQAQQESFIGILSSVKVFGDWAVGTVSSEERISVRVTGTALKELSEGHEFEFRGFKTHHAEYGAGFEVTSTTPHIRPDRRSIVKFIVRTYKGVTTLGAEKYVNHATAGAPDPAAALEAIRQQLLTAPWTLNFTGISKKATFRAAESDEVSPMLAYVQIGRASCRERV